MTNLYHYGDITETSYEEINELFKTHRSICIPVDHKHGLLGQKKTISLRKYLQKYPKNIAAQVRLASFGADQYIGWGWIVINADASDEAERDLGKYIYENEIETYWSMLPGLKEDNHKVSLLRETGNSDVRHSPKFACLVYTDEEILYITRNWYKK